MHLLAAILPPYYAIIKLAQTPKLLGTNPRRESCKNTFSSNDCSKMTRLTL